MPRTAEKNKWCEVKAKERDVNVDKIVGSEHFTLPSPLGPAVEARRKFYIFKRVGESIEGFLGAPIANVRRNTSYPLELTEGIADNPALKEGDTVEFFGNKLLHCVIRDNELIGARIRIEYIGHQFIPGYGRRRKVFRVFKAEGLSEKEQFKTK